MRTPLPLPKRIRPEFLKRLGVTSRVILTSDNYCDLRREGGQLYIPQNNFGEFLFFLLLLYRESVDEYVRAYFAAMKTKGSLSKRLRVPPILCILGKKPFFGSFCFCLLLLFFCQANHTRAQVQPPPPLPRMHKIRIASIRDVFLEYNFLRNLFSVSQKLSPLLFLSPQKNITIPKRIASQSPFYVKIVCNTFNISYHPSEKP